MKKIFAIALAAVMMFAVCVPAFASGPVGTVDITATKDDVNVKTVLDASEEGSYTITIPAEINITWGDTSAVDAAWSVDHQLLIGASLKVSAAANAEGVMTLAGADDTLTFTVANGDEVEYTGAGADVKSSTTVSIADFSGVTIGEYVGTMTYTVAYTAPTAA